MCEKIGLIPLRWLYTVREGGDDFFGPLWTWEYCAVDDLLKLCFYELLVFYILFFKTLFRAT